MDWNNVQMLMAIFSIIFVLIGAIGIPALIIFIVYKLTKKLIKYNAECKANAGKKED